MYNFNWGVKMISDVKAVSSLEKVFVDSSIDNLLE